MLEHRYVHRVRYRECDRMGIVYHAHFVDHFEAARTEMLRDHGITYKEIEDSGVFIQVVEVNIRYHRPVFYDDQIEVRTMLDEMPATRLVLRSEIRRVGDPNVLTSGTVTMCFVDAVRERPVRAPEYLKQAFATALGQP